MREVLAAAAAGQPSFSFEFFPPKTEDENSQLWKAIRELEVLHPSFVSVTYGAGGSTRARTIEITSRIATDTTLLPVAHLTAVNHSVAELRAIAGDFAANGITNLLALRGDPPGYVTGPWVAHPEGVSHADELVRLLKASGDFTVGVAAFPHGHPRSTSLRDDAEHLIGKFRAGAEYAISQMFFDIDDYLRLRERVAAAGAAAGLSAVPVIAGLMPITNFGMIARSEKLTGAPFPPRLGARFAAVAHDAKSVRAMGIYETSKLAERLLAEGVPGIQFFTLNRSGATREVWANLALGAA